MAGGDYQPHAIDWWLDDPATRGLSRIALGLLTQLASDSALGKAHVGAWSPGRYRCQGETLDDIEQALAELADAGLVAVDSDRVEVFCRWGLVQDERLLRQWNSAAGPLRAMLEVRSESLRAALIETLDDWAGDVHQECVGAISVVVAHLRDGAARAPEIKARMSRPSGGLPETSQETSGRPPASPLRRPPGGSPTTPHPPPSTHHPSPATLATVAEVRLALGADCPTARAAADKEIQKLIDLGWGVRDFEADRDEVAASPSTNSVPAVLLGRWRANADGSRPLRGRPTRTRGRRRTGADTAGEINWGDEGGVA